jgi:hypothetical protein
MPSKVRPPKTRAQLDRVNLVNRQKRARKSVCIEGLRRCAYPECTTILSRFNSRDICAPHERLTARTTTPSLFNCDF